MSISFMPVSVLKNTLLDWNLLSGFADIARVYGYCPAIGVTFLDQGLVERYPVKLLPEVHAKPLFGRAPELPHLKEVDAIWYSKKKFHGFDEETLKRFAYICLVGEGF